MAKTNAAFMSGVPELLLLKLLSKEEMYGYQLVRAIRERSSEAFDIAEGVVYPVLHGMEVRKLVKARERLLDNRSRIYYSLTAKGEKRLAELANDWLRVRNGIGLVLGGRYA